MLPEEDSQERLGSWNEVSSKITHPEEVIVQDIEGDGEGVNSTEVDVIMLEITSISSSPVSSVII
jgi:hypothetical protein